MKCVPCANSYDLPSLMLKNRLIEGECCVVGLRYQDKKTFEVKLFMRCEKGKRK